MNDTTMEDPYDMTMTSEYEITASANPSVPGLDGNKVHVIMYTLIGSIGMIDNGLVILVIALSKNMRKKICNLLILNQSVVDFLGAFFLVTDSPLVANGKPPAGLAGEIYCRLWANSCLLWIMFLVSEGNLVIITIDRFIEIVHPIKYKIHFTRQRAIMAIVGVWLLFTSLQVALVGYASRVNDNGDGCILHTNHPSNKVKMLNGSILYLIAIAMPVTVMTYCYARMLRAMRRIQPSSTSMPSSEQAHQLRKGRIRRNLIKTLISVAVAYVLCVSWNQTYFLLINLNVHLPFDGPFYHFSVYALFTNCLINPFIYTVKYREFQLSVKNLLSPLTKPCINQMPVSPDLPIRNISKDTPVVNNETSAPVIHGFNDAKSSNRPMQFSASRSFGKSYLVDDKNFSGNKHSLKTVSIEIADNDVNGQHDTSV